MLTVCSDHPLSYLPPSSPPPSVTFPDSSPTFTSFCFLLRPTDFNQNFLCVTEFGTLRWCLVGSPVVAWRMALTANYFKSWLWRTQVFYLLSYIKHSSPLALFLANGGFLGTGFHLCHSECSQIYRFKWLSCLRLPSSLGYRGMPLDPEGWRGCLMICLL